MNHLSVITYTKSGDYTSHFEAGVLLGEFQRSFPGDLFHFDLFGATSDALILIAKEIVEQITPAFGLRPRITCFDDGVILLRVVDRFFLEITTDSGEGDM